jgi:hypothetical protein
MTVLLIIRTIVSLNVSVFQAIARARLLIYLIVETLDSRAQFTHGLAHVSQPMTRKFSFSASVIPSPGE